MVATINCTLPYYFTTDPHREWDQYQRDLRLEEFRSMLEDELMNKADDDRKLEEEDEKGDY